MGKYKYILFDGCFTLATLLAVFGLTLLQQQFQLQNITDMLFVLGVFLVSVKTRGYFWGIAASLVSVLAVNWAFMDPYWAFDLISPASITSGLILLIVAVMTSALTTRLKHQEKLRADAQTERMRGNLLRAVSHDLRTPLTSIYGACSAMIESLPRQTQLKLLGDIRSDAQWLTRMVENLLSVTRVDAGTVRLSKQSTVLEELIDALLLKFHKHYPNQPVQVQIPEEFVSIPMDAMLIQQVLMNLLENAVFHAKGMRELRLRVTTERGLAYFFVEDDGCGIPPDRLARLFEGFPDSTASSDTGRGNMGIGLSVCRTIIKAHGGDITAKNRPQGGAAFRFWLEMEEDSSGEQV